MHTKSTADTAQAHNSHNWKPLRIFGRATKFWPCNFPIHTNALKARKFPSYIFLHGSSPHTRCGPKTIPVHGFSLIPETFLASFNEKDQNFRRRGGTKTRRSCAYNRADKHSGGERSPCCRMGITISNISGITLARLWCLGVCVLVCALVSLSLVCACVCVCAGTQKPGIVSSKISWNVRLDISTRTIPLCGGRKKVYIFLGGNSLLW